MPTTLPRPPVTVTDPAPRVNPDRALILAETARIFLAAGCDPAGVRACPQPLIAASADLMEDPSFLPALAGMDAVWEASCRCLP